MSYMNGERINEPTPEEMREHKRQAQEEMQWFNTICFLVLMQNGGGIMDRSPDYIREKGWLLRCEYMTAFRALDIYNMRKAVRWCDEWKVRVPDDVIAEMRLQEGAMQNLKEKGIDL